MSKVSRQFYALPENIARILLAIKDDVGLNVIMGTEIENTKLSFTEAKDMQQAFNNPDLRCVIFASSKCSIDFDSIDDFAMKNSDFIVLEIGRFRDMKLGESWLWTLSDNPEIQKAIKIMTTSLNSLTTSGMVATNPTTLKSDIYPALRYTDRVAELSSQGLVLVPGAGNAIITVPIK